MALICTFSVPDLDHFVPLRSCSCIICNWPTLIHYTPPFQHLTASHSLAMSYVTLDTSVGSLTVELYTDHAPKVGPLTVTDACTDR